MLKRFFLMVWEPESIIQVQQNYKKGIQNNMKIIIASDIHGSAYWCRQLIEVFHAEKADRLALLGDILYHGPRNALPAEYDPPKTAELLNAIRDRIICVRGNCDAEVDQWMLDFPMMADYSALAMPSRMIYLTHGHVYGKNHFPGLGKNDIVLSGQTHIPVYTPCEEGMFFNPGSVAIPKEGSKNGYMLLEDGVFTWKSFAEGTYAVYPLD